MKTLVSALAVASLAGSAFGLTDVGPLARNGSVSGLPVTVDRITNLGDITQYATFSADDRYGDDRGTPVYDTTSGTSFATITSTPSSPLIGLNDYQTSLHPGPFGDASDIAPLTGLERMIWVGGSASGSANVPTVDFFFLANDLSTAVAFTVTLPATTFAKWNITLNIPGGVYVPEEGFFAVFKNANSASEVRQAYTTLAPTVGDQSVPGWGDGYGPFFGFAGDISADIQATYREALRLEVPAPGAAALMGLAGLVGIRRRR